MKLELSENLTIAKYNVFLVLFTIFHFDLEKFISRNCKYIFFFQKIVHLGGNTSKNIFVL